MLLNQVMGSKEEERNSLPNLLLFVAVLTGVVICALYSVVVALVL